MAEGDFVVNRARSTGTHTGPRGDLPPSGKRLDLRWVVTISRVASGKIVEQWATWNQMDMMKQLGAIS